MSNKIDISQVAEVIKRHKVPPPELRAIIEELNELLNKEASEKEPKAPRGKKQFVIMLAPDQSTGWVFQLAESESPASLIDRVNRTAHDFNASRKGRLIPVKSHGDAIEAVPARFWRENDLAVKTKTPVAVIVSTNKLSEPPSV